MSAMLRHATTAVQVSRTRAFASSALARKDIIQNIYIREIKGYKPTPTAKGAHVGVVKNLSLPPPPRVPSLPTNLAAELAEYDAVEPSVATPTAAETVASSEEGAPGGAEAFLTFLEQDLPKPVEHHH